jgi:hypothetical protein
MLGMMNAMIALCIAVLVAATPIPRDPKPDFTSMRFLLGTWTCSISSSRRPRPFATDVSTTISRDGYWMLTRTVTPAVPWNPIVITNDDYITFDVTRNEWVDLAMDDYGAYEVSESRGWTGNEIAWADVAAPKLHGMSANGPRVMSKSGERNTLTRESFIETSGRHVAVTTACVRRSP